jgi:ribosomal-protein-alanine N-acetyltransferase
MQIETDRLVLRQFNQDDLDDLAALYGDPVVMRYYPQTYNLEETRQRLTVIISSYETDDCGLLATILKEDGTFAGRCGILPQHIEDEPLPEIGYMLHSAYWGRGLATEAARALRDYGFREFGYEAMYSLIRPVNKPSQAVALRNGMKLSRDVMHAALEHHLFCITRAEWLELEQAKNNVSVDSHTR